MPNHNSKSPLGLRFDIANYQFFFSWKILKWHLFIPCHSKLAEVILAVLR